MASCCAAAAHPWTSLSDPNKTHSQLTDVIVPQPFPAITKQPSKGCIGIYFHHGSKTSGCEQIKDAENVRLRVLRPMETVKVTFVLGM